MFYESMSQIWKNGSFGRNNKIKHCFYLFCLPASLLPAQGLFLTWNLDLGCLLAVSQAGCHYDYVHAPKNSLPRHPARIYTMRQSILLEVPYQKWNAAPRLFISVDAQVLNRRTHVNKTLRSVHFGVVLVELIYCKCGGIVGNEIW